MVFDYLIYISIEIKQLITAIYNFFIYFKILVETWGKTCKNSAISKKSHAHNFASNDLKLNQNVLFHM